MAKTKSVFKDYYNKYRKAEALLHHKTDENRDLKKAIKDYRIQNREISRMIDYYEKTQSLNRLALRPITARESSYDVEQGTVIACLSDIHGEHKITRAQTNGLNEYNPNICEQRLQEYFTNMIKLTRLFRKDIELDNLVLGLLGDLIHGFIHEEYVRTNYMTPIDASLWMTDILARGFKKLLEDGNFKRIQVVCKIGNHSRITKKVYSDEEAVHSYEWGIYKNLQKLFPEIGWLLEESYHSYTYIYDKVIRWHHGHAFRYMGGIGGITIPLMRYIAKLNRQRRADMDVIGHWHTRMFDATNGYIVNASVCGSDPYSIRLGFPVEEPTQAYQILDYNRGFTINAPIMLAHK